MRPTSSIVTGTAGWNAYFLYRPGVLWNETPPEEVSWGRTIVDSRERLQRDFTAVVADGEQPGER